MASTLAEALARARHALRAAGVSEADLDARLLVEHATGTTRLDAIARPDLPVAPAVLSALEAAVARRVAGEPVYRIIGRRTFYGLDLMLGPQTLEPRPDTETLVEAVVPAITAFVERRGECRILDLGTGTGAIALAVLSAVPGAEAVGADLSSEALAVAAANADALGLGDRFSTVRSDWFAAIDGRYGAILSNPPYISSDVMDKLAPEVRLHDPRLALDGGHDGLDAYRMIAADVGRFLVKDGIVGVEIGYDQKDQVSAIFAEAGYVLVNARRDLGGNDRALVFALSTGTP